MTESRVHEVFNCVQLMEFEEALERNVKFASRNS